MAIGLRLALVVFCINFNLLNCEHQFRDELASNSKFNPYLETNHESQQKNDKEMIEVERLLQNHHWDTWNPKVESIEKYLEKELNQLPINTEIIENRSKKSKNYDSNSETQPLKDHRRKGGEDFQDLANVAPSTNKLTCAAKYDIQKNMMIDSKTSVKNGATLITVEKIPPKEDLKLTELENSCMKLCCETDECDSSILSLKLGDEGYRCYLFKCQGNCFYIKHDDYVVSRMKSQEEIEGNKVKNDDSDQVITTGHRPDNDHSNGESSLDFIKIDNYAPDDKPYFYDKSKATTSSANVTMAILVLILGISLILSFFAYLFASTKYFRRRVKWFNVNKENKNVDVDGDYLINGMYL